MRRNSEKAMSIMPIAKRMPRARITPVRVALCFCMLILGASLFLPTPVRGYATGFLEGEKIYIPDSVFLNKNPYLETISHTFRIYNLQAKSIDLQAEPSCGCIQMSWQKKRLMPFGYASFTFTAPNPLDTQQAIAIRTDVKEKPYVFVFVQNDPSIQLEAMEAMKASKEQVTGVQLPKIK